jgi:hypothetical protein
MLRARVKQVVIILWRKQLNDNTKILIHLSITTLFCVDILKQYGANNIMSLFFMSFVRP